MPRRIVSLNQTKSNRNRKKSDYTRRSVARRINFTPKKTNRFNIIFQHFMLLIKNIKFRNINIENIFLIKSKMIMSTTIILSCFVGYITLNNLIEPQKQVSAIEQPILPERQLPGVSATGHKFADSAIDVMKKLQSGQYENNGKKVVYLTFDDGPSSNTEDILNILVKNKIKATFFVAGQSIENSGQKGKKLLQRIYEDGNAIANHSFSQDYNILYPNKKLDINAFLEDFQKTDKLLSNILGENFTTKVIRCPGGQMSWQGMDVLQSYLDKTGMASIDWNALSVSEFSKIATANDIYNEIVETSKEKEMVVLLMHDMSSKTETVNALQKIIDYYKKNGYEFRTLI